MKISKLVALITVFLITATTAIATKGIEAESSADYQVTAQTSDSFVESLGIGTKFGYCPGRLCDNYSEVKALLAQLGIRYIRDIPFPEPWRIRTNLYQDHGIQMLAEAGRTWGKPLDLENISARLNAIKSWGEMIVGIVGVNEYDNPTYHFCEETEGCDPDWSEENWSVNYLQFQQRLYDRVKADSKLRHLPVVMGPMAHLDNLEELDEDDLDAICDRGNDHSYPGAWGKPSQESGWGEKATVRSMDEVVTKVQRVCPGKIWITETGYEETTEDRNQYFVTRQAKAKYLPRIYANYYLQQDIERTFLYELLNATKTGTSFGIIDTNLKPTPAYYAIKNMISLLEEATWNKSTQSWKYPDFKPDRLEYTLEGNTTDVRHLLLQKSDGTFYLLIWQEVYAYDNKTGKDLVNRDRQIEFKLNGSTLEKANKYLLYNESNPATELLPLKTWTNISNLSLNIPDHILILEFTLKN